MGIDGGCVRDRHIVRIEDRSHVAGNIRARGGRKWHATVADAGEVRIEEYDVSAVRDLPPGGAEVGQPKLGASSATHQATHSRRRHCELEHAAHLLCGHLRLHVSPMPGGTDTFNPGEIHPPCCQACRSKTCCLDRATIKKPQSTNGGGMRSFGKLGAV